MSEQRSAAALERRRARKRMRYATDATYREREKIRARQWRKGMKRVTVAYDGGINPELDRLLRHTVLAAGGREMGSGSMMVAPFTRDIDFELPDAQAQSFIDGLQVFEWALQNLRVVE